MPLNPTIVELLNKFADSQPALRLPDKPLGSSNPQLGTLLAADFAAVEEALKDLKTLTAKLDLDAGVADEDFAEVITDDNP